MPPDVDKTKQRGHRNVSVCGANRDKRCMKIRWQHYNATTNGGSGWAHIIRCRTNKYQRIGSKWAVNPCVHRNELPRSRAKCVRVWSQYGLIAMANTQSYNKHVVQNGRLTHVCSEMDFVFGLKFAGDQVTNATTRPR